MAAQERIVIYRAPRLAEDAELVAAIQAATGVDPSALAEQLDKQPATYLPAVAREVAEELAALLRARGLDFDVEPVAQPPERVEWLSAEIPKWVKRGFLPAQSLPGLYWNYGLEAPAAAVTGSGAAGAAGAAKSERDPGFLIRAILAIGSVLVGLGLILFIASNWQRIPAPAKIGGALALTLMSLHLGSWLRFERGRSPRLAICFLTIALFGIGGVLTLIAQVYHLLAGTYLLPLVWGLLCLPVAFLLRFRPALYLASGLWLWSYWLYPASHDRLPWYYAALLLGFLLPYSIAAGDRILYRTHVAVLMLALVSTVGTGDFWLCTLWLAALAVLAYRDRRPLFDWLLAVGFVFWAVTFFQLDDDLPNVFYALPLAWFFFRAWRRRDNAFLLATVVNALVWWLLLLLHVIERFDVGEATATGVLLWALASGLLVYGFGAWLRQDQVWRPASLFLRGGGASLMLIMVYVMGFRFYARERAFFESPALLGASLAAGAFGLALALQRRRGPTADLRRIVARRRGELGLLALVALALGLAMVLSPALGLHVVLFNLILFLAALLSMLEGHRGQSLLWYNLGIGLFVVLIATRYFDTFVDLLPRSVFFVLGGIFLIVWAVLADRQRRHREPRGPRAADGGAADV